MNWETILFLGDSITIGSRSYLGYPEYCGSCLEEKTAKHWNVINCAQAGFTVIDLVRHIDKNWAHLKESGPELVSIMIGTNDLKAGTAIRDFEIAFSLLVVKARLLVGTNYIILNKIPLLQNGVMLPYNSKMNKTVHEYNSLIDKIAEREGLLLNTMPESIELFYDGVHLNNEGSRKWGEKLAATILDLRNADQ